MNILGGKYYKEIKIYNLNIYYTNRYLINISCITYVFKNSLPYVVI